MVLHLEVVVEEVGAHYLTSDFLVPSAQDHLDLGPLDPSDPLNQGP